MKNLALVILLSYTFLEGYGQTNPLSKVQEFLPPSPEAQEFVKYGNYPVGMYTGVPNISIPLYTIVAKDITVPITLLYHAAGIQVDQVASRVGLGWSLNAGGIITRIPKGKPDDDVSFGFLSTGWNVPEINDVPSESEDPMFWKQAAQGDLDFESDIYQYNFGNYSGKFFFDRDKQLRLIDKVPLKIKYRADTQTFSITTETGMVYHFLETESTTVVIGAVDREHVSSWHLTNISSSSWDAQVHFLYDDREAYSTIQRTFSETVGDDPWENSNNNNHNYSLGLTTLTYRPKQVKEIIFPNGKIIFNSLDDRYDGPSLRLDEMIVYSKVSESYQKLKSYKFDTDYFYSNVSTSYGSLLGSSSPLRYRLRLNKLREYGNVGDEVPKIHTFTYNQTVLPPRETNGKDFWGYYNGKNLNSTLVPKQERPFNGIFVGMADRKPSSTDMKAGILQKISYPTGGHSEFEYGSHKYSTMEEETVQRSLQAFAGGSNQVPEHIVTFTPNADVNATVEVNATNTTGGAFPRVTLDGSGSDNRNLVDYSHTPYEYGGPQDYDPLVSRTFFVVLKQGVTYTLKATASGSSTYNEGAHPGYAFMHAEVSYKEETGTMVEVENIAGGLRVENIKSYDANGIFTFGKEYDYVNSKLITDEFFLDQNYVDEGFHIWRFMDTGPTSGYWDNLRGDRRVFYGGTVQQLSLNSGSPVVYTKVVETSIDSIGSINGITERNFIPEIENWNTGGYNNWRALIMYKDHWRGGQDLGSTFYAIDSTEVSKKENIYLPIPDSIPYRFYKIVYKRSHEGENMGGPPPLTEIDGLDYFATVEYPVSSGALLLEEQIATDMDGPDKRVASTTKYRYDNHEHLQVTRKETVTSDGKAVIVSTIYPDDVTDTGALGLPFLGTLEKQAIDSLKYNGLHRIAIPIQESIVINDSFGVEQSQLVRRNNYHYWPNGMVLSREVVSQKGIYEPNTNPMEGRIMYHNYDNNGNPIEISIANGPHIYYIWGYKKQFPIAKLENLNSSQITPTLLGLINAAVSASDWDDDATRNYLGSEGFVRQTLDDLKNSLPDNTVMTSYTYDPLVGVTSITDPRGETIYYSYDSFNQLKEVRDSNGNLVTDFKYNYKNSIEP